MLRTETSTAVTDFKISAQCAPLFHGNATAVMCATSRETWLEPADRFVLADASARVFLWT